MTSGGWEWRADRERWVAHAPIERGTVVLGLFVLLSQTFFFLTAPEDAPIQGRPWMVAVWLAVVIPWTIHLLSRMRHQDVTYDGEVVTVVHGWARTAFRPTDVVDVHPGPLVNRDLLVLRVRPLERTVAGVPVPTWRRGARVTADVPSWWWHQIVGLPPERVTPSWTQRVRARLRRRPVLGA